MIIAEVTQANMLATWQDLGRTHSTHHGVGQSGAMDLHAVCWANKLLGYEIDHPLIEITVGLFSVRFNVSCLIAITGADLGITLNGKAIQHWQTQIVKQGDELKFNSAKSGLRAYLAIGAKIELETVFDSASTVIREQLPGLLGRPLRGGDQLVGVADMQAATVSAKQVPSEFIPNYAEPLTLDLIASYQFYQFPKSSIDQLLTSEYQIQPNSSRMAYLLKGNAIEHSLTSLASEGIAYGAIQVPPDGQPVILLNDRQTMGGYPKLGCISRLSGSALSQRFAPTTVRFKLVSVDGANQSYKKLLNFFSSSV